jgi:hypothetical protein
MMSSSTTDAPTGFCFDPEDLECRQLISFSDNLLSVTILSNIKSDTVEVLKSSDGDELWTQKMSGSFPVMGIYKFVVSGVDPSGLASAEVLNFFQVLQ